VFVAAYIAKLLLLLFQLQSHDHRRRVATIEILRRVSYFSLAVAENQALVSLGLV